MPWLGKPSLHLDTVVPICPEQRGGNGTPSGGKGVSRCDCCEIRRSSLSETTGMYSRRVRTRYHSGGLARLVEIVGIGGL